jgi:ribonuclease D
LKELIEDDSVVKIGLSLKDDFGVLRRSAQSGTIPDSFVELQSLVKTYGISDISLQKIYGILFDKRISKSQRLSNWEAQELTSAQQEYAAIDAWACLKIYDYLLGGNFNYQTSKYLKNIEEEIINTNKENETL